METALCTRLDKLQSDGSIDTSRQCVVMFQFLDFKFNLFHALQHDENAKCSFLVNSHIVEMPSHSWSISLPGSVLLFKSLYKGEDRMRDNKREIGGEEGGFERSRETRESGPLACSRQERPATQEDSISYHCPPPVNSTHHPNVHSSR